MSGPNRHARFAELLERFDKILRRTLARHCRSDAGLDPDEIAQDVRIRLWRAVEDDRIGDLHASYVQKLVISAVIDAVRRRKVRDAERLDELEGSPDALTESQSPLRSAAGGEVIALVAASVMALPERRRVPVQLHLQGFGFVEIGDLLRVSAESARKLVTRGMDELRERLEAAGVNDHGEL